MLCYRGSFCSAPGQTYYKLNCDGVTSIYKDHYCVENGVGTFIKGSQTGSTCVTVTDSVLYSSCPPANPTPCLARPSSFCNGLGTYSNVDCNGMRMVDMINPYHQ